MSNHVFGCGLALVLRGMMAVMVHRPLGNEVDWRARRVRRQALVAGLVRAGALAA